jgi:type I restriction enzyme S subunit
MVLNGHRQRPIGIFAFNGDIHIGGSAWKEAVLSEIIDLIGGGTPKTKIKEYWDGNIPWLSVVDFNTGNKFVFDTEKKITQDGLENSSTKLLEEGDIIISARGTVGVVAILGKKMAFNQSCYGIKAIDGKSTNNYVYYLLKDAVLNFIQIAHGGVFDTITRDTFDEIDISLPPLPEQKANRVLFIIKSRKAVMPICQQRI